MNTNLKIENKRAELKFKFGESAIQIAELTFSKYFRINRRMWFKKEFEACCYSAKLAIQASSVNTTKEKPIESEIFSLYQ